MIGERIRELRKARGWSQGTLAQKVGNDGNTISRWELDKVGIGAEYLSKLAEVLETTTDYLLGKTDNPNHPSAGTRATNPAPAPQRGDIDITIPPTADAGQLGRIVYEWGGDNRLELPDTPEGRAEMMKFIERIMAAGYIMDSAEMKQDAEPPPASSPAPDGASRSA